jgi:hypothetical protein
MQPDLIRLSTRKELELVKPVQCNNKKNKLALVSMRYIWAQKKRRCSSALSTHAIELVEIVISTIV